MDVKEDKQMEKQRVREKTIPVFTVLKNGAILKNIFVVNSRDFSSPERNGNDDEVEEILLVGRHPDCDILLTHPSISRYHLQIRTVPSRQKLFVTDLSSVHGTWVTDERVEPDACVEVKEGNVIRIGGSTRIYRLHWIPLSRAYDIDNPFVSPLDASTVMEQDEENRMLEVENLEVAHQSLEKAALVDDGDLHLDVTSEGSGSSVPSEDEDTYITTREISLPLASPSVLTLARDSVNTQKLQLIEDLQDSSKWDLDVADKPTGNCASSKQQSCGYAEVFGCSKPEVSAEADEWDVRGDGGLLLNVMSERMESSVFNEDEDPYLTAKETSSLPLPRDSIEKARLQLTEDVQASPEKAVNIIEAKAEYPSCGCSPVKGQIDDGCSEASGCTAFELAAEVEILSLRREVIGETEFVTKQVMEATAEPTKADIQSHVDNGEIEVSGKVIAVSPNSSPQAERLLEIVTEDALGVLGSEFWSEVSIETDSENLHHKLNEVNPAGDQDKKPGMNRETEQIFDEGSSSCLSEDLKQMFLMTPNQKPRRESSIGFERSEESYSLGEMEGERNTDTGSPIASTLAVETYEDTKPVKEELPSDYTGSQENQTPQTQAVRDDVLSEMDSSRSSPIRLSTCNIWSRRGKATSVLQVRTNRNKGKQKQIGNQPKGQLHRNQALNDKPISLTVHHGAEKLEPEIFTPDKENLTPSSHMLKRLQDIGDIEDSKSSSKLSGKSFLSKIPSNIAIVASGALTEPEIFTPDKENLTPNSHMLKCLREVGEIKETKGSSSKAIRKPFFDIHVEGKVMAEQKPHSMSITSKVKHDEPVAMKKIAERAPFQPLLKKSSSQSQSYTEASSTASARNNISRGIRSSSNLSDGKNKMKWTIVLDTSSLLDKESRKALHLLQGLKGTHLVVPRIVLRELNETKRTRSLFFRRTTEIASSALDWIEECKVNTKWWIQLQSPSEETKATAPTPPVTPQSNGSAFPFSLHWNHNAPEIDSPTSQDQVLECALLYRNRNIDEKLVLLSNDVTLKIKTMAEGVICETPNEFYESLKNPFSERFMWTESLPRGRTWSHLDDVVLRERYNNNRTCFPYRKKSMFNGGRGENGAAAKGLKLILLHNSHYGHIH